MQSFIISHSSCAEQYGDMSPDTHTHARTHARTHAHTHTHNIDSNIFFEIKESKITRGHNYTLVKKQSRLDVRKYSFSQRTINVWNKLSTDCVHASSVNMFKNKIDKYLAKAGYT